MGLKLSAPERAKAEDLTRPAYFALVLQNDLYSWEREYREAQAQALNDEQSQSIDVTNMMNAIWVLMQEHNHLDIAGAQELCRIKIKQYTTEYIQIVENVKGDQSLSVDLVKYVEALKYDIVGQAAWCMTCPRNHPDISFTEEQLEWMRGVVLPVAESGTPNSKALKVRSALSDSTTRMPIVASNRKMSLAKSHSGTEH
ncbi:hypothetical protein D9757_008697 [Collybiopsis confluens]|nr:hypothetical protein D9757_008697 [Collybiopsis confluens]